MANRSLGTGAFVREYRRRTADLEKLIEVPSGAISPETIHELRVAARKAASMRKLLPRTARSSPEWKRYRNFIEGLLESTSDLRDSDVVQAVLSPFQDIVPRRVLGRLAAGRRNQETRLRTILRGLPSGLSPKLDSDALDGTSLTKRLNKEIDGRLVSVRKLVLIVSEKPDSIKDLHRLRIHVRKIRYTLELTKQDEKGADILRRWQNLLGEVHDLHLASEYLSGIDSGTAAGKARKEVKSDLRRKQKRLARRLGGDLSDLERSLV